MQKKIKYCLIVISLLIIVSAIFFACKKEPDSPNTANKIEFGNTEVDTVTYWTAKITSSVIDLANNEIVNYGHCWSMEANPTIEDSKSGFGSMEIPGEFTSTLEGINDGTVYYVRAYVTFLSGTAYNEEITFQTVSDPCKGEKELTYEGKIYKMVPIGNQCWMTDNLDVGVMINGDQGQADNGIIEKYCYDNDSMNCKTYGAFYQWDEVMQYANLEGSQGICMVGWHLPSENDWKILEGFTDSQYNYGDVEWNKDGLRGFDAGQNLKTTTGWVQNGNGTDKYGFNALPGGRHTSNGSFFDKGQSAYFWSSTAYANVDAWGRMLNAGYDKIYRFYYNRENARYVRCLKND